MRAQFLHVCRLPLVPSSEEPGDIRRARDQDKHLCASCKGKAYLLSQQTVREIVNSVRSGTKPLIPCGRKAVDSSVPRTDLQKHFHVVATEIAESLGEAMPHVMVRDPSDPTNEDKARGLVCIPNSVYPTKQEMYEDLRGAGRLTRDGVEISYIYFVELWRRYMWNVRCRKWICFAKCTECTQLRYG